MIQDRSRKMSKLLRILRKDGKKRYNFKKYQNISFNKFDIIC